MQESFDDPERIQGGGDKPENDWQEREELSSAFAAFSGGKTRETPPHPNPLKMGFEGTTIRLRSSVAKRLRRLEHFQQCSSLRSG